MKCTITGHENEDIIGCCLNTACQQNFTVCALCTIDDEKNLHLGHREFCQGFQQIITYFIEDIELLISSNENFQSILQIFSEIEVLIIKNFTFKSEEILKNLSNTQKKLTQIYQFQQKRVDQIQNLLKIVEQRDFDKIYHKKLEIKILFSQYPKYEVFDNIQMLLENSIKIQYKKISEMNIQYLIYKEAKILFKRVQQLATQGNFAPAIELLNEAILRNPFYIDALIQKGLILQKQQKYQDAIKCYDEVIKLNPNDKQAINNKCNIDNLSSVYTIKNITQQ